MPCKLSFNEEIASLVMYMWWKYYSLHVTQQDLAGKYVLDVTEKTMMRYGDWNERINRRDLVLQYVVSKKLISRLVPLFQVVETAD
jgi:hypothetical protein